MTIPVWSRVLALVLTGVSAIFVLLLWNIDSVPALNLASSHHQNVISTPKIADDGEYLVGLGRADITGPVVEINMMGYADTAQSGTGLRQRLYCRAFIVGSLTDPNERIAYLVLDTQSGDAAVRYGILQGLNQLGEEYSIYTKHDGSALAVTGTHSHSGPGAWLNYLLPQITSKGFDKNSYDAIVDGSILAIKRAHESLQPGHLKLGRGQALNINTNRSPYAYLANPKKERAQYSSDVDTEMTVLSFEDTNNIPLGVLTWFPVHGTSLYQNNTLITGDNKGVAAYLLEQAMKGKNANYVAGFSQSNVGDTSPNVLGAFCQDTGLPCRFNDSTCGGRTQPCHGRGPYFQVQDQGTKSCFEIGKRQFEAAQGILDSMQSQHMEKSTISSFHTFVDLSNYTFVSPFNASKVVRTCSAALGYGFAGGTTDGPGAFDFTQGTNDTDDDSPSLKNPLWKVARAFIHQPSDEQIKCQEPKPVLLDVGAAEKPYAWSPNVVDLQVLRIGPLIMIIAPGEATTMSGRRWRQAIVSKAADTLSLKDAHAVIGGPANTYAHYIATEEEYSIQRYEGASTLYGKHTLAAYINLTTSLLSYLDTKEVVDTLPPLPLGPQPPINVNSSYSFINGVVLDNAGFFKSFGQQLTPPEHSTPYSPGDTASVKFVGANPRNNFRLEGTFAAVEKYDTQKAVWTEVRSDKDWYLVYHWERKSTVLGTSEVTIEWTIEDETQNGLYRFKYYGDAKSVGGTITPFEGTSDVFKVSNTASRDELLARGIFYRI